MSHQLTQWILQELEKSAQKESLLHAGDRTVEYTRLMKRGSIASTLALLGVLIFCSIVAPPADRQLVAGGFGLILLLPLFLALEACITRITYEERGIRTQSAWRFSRFIPFSDIVSCDYSFVNHWYRIRTRNYGIIRLSVYMRGLTDLLKLLPCPHPGYPPANTLENMHSPQMLAATEPVRPARTTGAKVIATFFFAFGLGAFVRWPFYEIPDRAQFTEINGEVAEMSTQSTGEDQVLLKVRMTHAPALLTWSSVKGRGARLQELFKEIRQGDPITVLVPKKQLAHPAKAMLAAEPQIWFAALRAGRKGKEYLTFENHVLWHRENRRSFLIIGGVCCALGMGMYWEAARKERRWKAGSWQR